MSKYYMQYCNGVHYVNSGGGGGGDAPQLETLGGGGGGALPPRFLRLCLASLTEFYQY